MRDSKQLFLSSLANVHIRNAPQQPLYITRKVTTIFAEHFQAKHVAKKTTDRIEPQDYGQSITTDDALQILEQCEKQ